jgi:hypothetical protein
MMHDMHIQLRTYFALGLIKPVRQLFLLFFVVVIIWIDSEMIAKALEDLQNVLFSPTL